MRRLRTKNKWNKKTCSDNGGTPPTCLKTSELYTKLHLQPFKQVRRLITIEHNQHSPIGSDYIRIIPTRATMIIPRHCERLTRQLHKLHGKVTVQNKSHRSSLTICPYKQAAKMEVITYESHQSEANSIISTKLTCSHWLKNRDAHLSAMKNVKSVVC